MNDVIIQIAPIILTFLLAYLLKVFHVFKESTGESLLKIVFYISIPALLIDVLRDISLEKELLLLPLSAIICALITFIVSYLISKHLKLKSTTSGTFLIGALMMNIGFLYPFFINSFGPEGVAKLALFDFGNTIVIYSLAYYIAHKKGRGKKENNLFIKKFLLSPPIWGLLIGLFLNISNTQVPLSIDNFISSIAATTSPLIILSLGFYFNHKISGRKLVSLGIFLRMGLGLLIGVMLSYLFKLEGLMQVAVILGSAAPIAFMTLTFSSIEKLDVKFAANLVSYSILAGMIITPLLIVAIK